MSERNDGGPAFPAIESGAVSDSPNRDGYHWLQLDSTRGMSLRDYFAGQALVGFLSAHAHPGNEAGVSTDDAAIAAYRIADAMLKARERA